MKIIFDFDDVVFDAKKFKRNVFSGLLSYGIDENVVKEIYNNHRKIFNPSLLYKEVLEKNKIHISSEEINQLIDNLFQGLPIYIDQRMIDLMCYVGKENCFIVTAGDEDFQRKKIKFSLGDAMVLDNHILFVKEKKDEKLKYICELYKDEAIIFVDDKDTHIQEVKALKMNNLYTVLYDEQGFDSLHAMISFCKTLDKKLS